MNSLRRLTFHSLQFTGLGQPLLGATPVFRDKSRSVHFGFASLLQDGLATLAFCSPLPSFSFLPLFSLSHLHTGGWTASNITSGKISGNATTLVFASALAHNNAAVVYTFSTFANATVITLGTRHPPAKDTAQLTVGVGLSRIAGNNETLPETPQYLKFSMRLAF
jgi:hypothetical protein